MIDIEIELIDRISAKLREQCEEVYVTGEYVKSPPTFPCVSIVEVDNQVYRNGRDSGEIENFAQVAYEINVYSNKKVGRKTECKRIMGIADLEMAKLGFTRTVYTPVQNERDATIYRIVTRYRAVVDKNKTIYRR